MRVILTGGGTGGHIYPALAIGDKIKEREPDSEILYIGNEMGIEKEIVPAAGYEFRMVPARWLERRKNKLDYFCQLGLTGAVTCGGTAKALSIMRKFRPDAVIGTGGFVCVPVVLAGKMYGARTFIHEQNAFPGAANRLLSKYADRIFLGFSEGREYFSCPEKLVYTGNPVRKDFLGITREEARKLLNIPEDSFTVFSFGGSMGSETINSIAVRIIKEVNGKEELSMSCKYGEEGWQPVTKYYAFHQYSAIKIGAYDDNGELIELGTVSSGLTDEIKQNMSENPELYLGTVVSLDCMSIDKKEHTLRHPVFKAWRNDKNPEDCKISEVFV